MSSYNKVILMGNLTRDVELRHTASNTAVASLGLATNRKYKDGQGQQQEEVCFIDATAWGKTAETIAQYFSKGQPILIEGYLKLDEWEDKNGGGKRSKIQVVIERFTFVGGGGQQSSPNQAGGGSPATFSNSDIPFSPDDPIRRP
jgi:single-strand DNA-binding protein